MLRALLLLGRAGQPGRGLGGRRCHALTARRIDSPRISLASSIDELWPCNSFSISVAKVLALVDNLKKRMGRSNRCPSRKKTSRRGSTCMPSRLSPPGEASPGMPIMSQRSMREALQHLVTNTLVCPFDYGCSG